MQSTADFLHVFLKRKCIFLWHYGLLPRVLFAGSSMYYLENVCSGYILSNISLCSAHPEQIKAFSVAAEFIVAPFKPRRSLRNVFFVHH